MLYTYIHIYIYIGAHSEIIEWAQTCPAASGAEDNLALVHIYIYIYICMYVYVYICICIYVHPVAPPQSII